VRCRDRAGRRDQCGAMLRSILYSLRVKVRSSAEPVVRVRSVPVGSALCKGGGRWYHEGTRRRSARRILCGRAEPVAGERLMRILSLLSAGGETNRGRPPVRRVRRSRRHERCGIMLMADDAPVGSVCTTNEVSNVIEELQYELGEGPCVDAHQGAGPYSSPTWPPRHTRWLAFSPRRWRLALGPSSASPSGGSGPSRSDEPVPRPAGKLSDDQHADALVMADVAASPSSPCRPTHPSTLWPRSLKPVPTSTWSSTKPRAWWRSARHQRRRSPRSTPSLCLQP